MDGGSNFLMPTPNEGESQKDFVGRCIPIVKSESPGMENKQAVAICFSKFREHTKKNAVEDLKEFVTKLNKKIKKDDNRVIKY